MTDDPNRYRLRGRYDSDGIYRPLFWNNPAYNIPDECEFYRDDIKVVNKNGERQQCKDIQK